MAVLRSGAVAVLLLACLGAASAAKYPTAWEALSSDKDLSTFTHVAEVAGLRPYLKSTYTKGVVFAPTNEAIAAFLKAHGKAAADVEKSHNQLLVDRIVANHLVLEKAPATIKDGTYTSVANAPLAIKGSTITGPQGTAKIVSSDLTGGKVTIAKIDNVLLPGTVFPTIKAALAYSPTTSELAKLIAADPVLAKAAADPATNVTLFAPANSAIKTLAANPAAAKLLADKAAVHKILAYHAATGARILPHFSGASTLTLPTLLPNATLKVSKVYSKAADGSKTGKVEVLANSAGAKPVFIRKHNIIAGSSVIDVVDGVLVPKL